jgi:hypothetical protein
MAPSSNWGGVILLACKNQILSKRMAKARTDVSNKGQTGQPAAIRIVYIPYTLNDGVVEVSKVGRKMHQACG